jgi:hypothetical protein
MLFCAMRIFAGVDGANRQSMTSVSEVTAEEGREKFKCSALCTHNFPLHPDQYCVHHIHSKPCHVPDVCVIMCIFNAS